MVQGLEHRADEERGRAVFGLFWNSIREVSLLLRQQHKWEQRKLPPDREGEKIPDEGGQTLQRGPGKGIVSKVGRALGESSQPCAAFGAGMGCLEAPSTCREPRAWQEQLPGGGRGEVVPARPQTRGRQGSVSQSPAGANPTPNARKICTGGGISALVRE